MSSGMPRAYVRRPRAGRAVRAGDGRWDHRSGPPLGATAGATAGDGGRGLSVSAPTVPPMVAALSPSRASDFMQCPLLYRFRVIDRLPQAPSAAAARGTLVHSVLERLFDLPGGRAHARRGRRDASRRSGTALLEAEPELADAVPRRRRRGAGAVARRRRGAGRARGSSWRTPPGSSRPSASSTSRPISRRADPARLRRPARRRARPARSGSSTTRPGAHRRELFEAKALFQMRFYALVLWRLRGVVPAHAAAGLPRQRRDRAVLPGRATTCGPPSARSRRCGRRSSARPPTGDWRPRTEPAVRLVRPPGPLPGLGRHSPRAPRGRRAPRPQPARFSRRRPQRGLSGAGAAVSVWRDTFPSFPSSSASELPEGGELLAPLARASAAAIEPMRTDRFAQGALGGRHRRAGALHCLPSTR